uniref:Uncharacterized protein n=1 Tax=Lepeophtheirus salmonis TaxID=72036 RepID=A0A0K2TBP1_LEPSM
MQTKYVDTFIVLFTVFLSRIPLLSSPSAQKQARMIFLKTECRQYLNLYTKSFPFLSTNTSY